MNVMSQLRAVGRGECSFDDLRKQFETATFTGGRTPTAGGWDAVYQRADDGPDDDDIPAAVHAASYAGHISKDQGKQLIDIWTRKVTPSA